MKVAALTALVTSCRKHRREEIYWRLSRTAKLWRDASRLPHRETSLLGKAERREQKAGAFQRVALIMKLSLFEDFTMLIISKASLVKYFSTQCFISASPSRRIRAIYFHARQLKMLSSEIVMSNNGLITVSK